MTPPPAQRAMSARAGSTVTEVAGKCSRGRVHRDGGHRDDSGSRQRLAVEFDVRRLVFRTKGRAEHEPLRDEIDLGRSACAARGSGG